MQCVDSSRSLGSWHTWFTLVDDFQILASIRTHITKDQLAGGDCTRLAVLTTIYTFVKKIGFTYWHSNIQSLASFTLMIHMDSLVRYNRGCSLIRHTARQRQKTFQKTVFKVVQSKQPFLNREFLYGVWVLVYSYLRVRFDFPSSIQR